MNRTAGVIRSNRLKRPRKTLQTRLEKLNQKEKKDHVVTFEELGVDHLYVDEAHSYKNAFLYTKMRNVAGTAQNEAQKSADMFNKCQYLDEITGGKGITFATGTPISNSMTELICHAAVSAEQQITEYGTWDCLIPGLPLLEKLSRASNLHRKEPDTEQNPDSPDSIISRN